MAASTTTPEPRLCSVRSRGVSGRPKNWRNSGSSKYGSRTGTRVLVEMFTTAGVTLCSIGASEGIGWPSTAGGSAARLVNGSVPSASTLHSPSVRVMRPIQCFIDFLLVRAISCHAAWKRSVSAAANRCSTAAARMGSGWAMCGVSQGISSAGAGRRVAPADACRDMLRACCRPTVKTRKKFFTSRAPSSTVSIRSHHNILCARPWVSPQSWCGDGCLSKGEAVATSDPAR